MKSRELVAGVFFLILTAGTSFGHQDPLGDVHPKVVVEDGKFSVYFKNNREKKCYRRVLGPKGEVVLEREEVPAIPDPQPAGQFDEKQTGISVRRGDEWFLFPNWSRKHDGKPSYHLVRGGRVVKTVELPWGDRVIDIVHDATVAGDDVLIQASPKGDDHFYLFRFGELGKARPDVLDLGVPRRIYRFPVASNVAIHGDEYLVCWVTKEKQLVCTLWSPNADEKRTLVLREKVFANTTVSIGVIGDNLLVARHTLGKEGALVETIHRLLEKHRVLDKGKPRPAKAIDVSIGELARNPGQLLEKRIRTSGVVTLEGDYDSRTRKFLLKDGNSTFQVASWVPLSVAMPPPGSNRIAPRTMHFFLGKHVRLEGVVKSAGKGKYVISTDRQKVIVTGR